MYSVTYETPGGARAPKVSTHFGEYETLTLALALADSIFDLVKNFAVLNTPNRVFESRKRVTSEGAVLEIFLVGTSPYKTNSGSLVGYILCREL